MLGIWNVLGDVSTCVGGKLGRGHRRAGPHRPLGRQRGQVLHLGEHHHSLSRGGAAQAPADGQTADHSASKLGELVRLDQVWPLYQRFLAVGGPLVHQEDTEHSRVLRARYAPHLVFSGRACAHASR